MNRISNVILLAAVAAVGINATARTMTATRPGEVKVRPGVEVEVRGTTRTSPADAIVKDQPMSMEQFRKMQEEQATGTQVNFQDEKGITCNVVVYGQKLSDGTKVGALEAQDVLKGGYIKQGVCGTEEGALLGYSADARETLLLATSELRRSFQGRAFHQLSSAERVQAMVAMAEILAKVKNRNGGNFTAESEAKTVAKISGLKKDGGCELIPKAN